jgi:hypothetical protein
MFSVFYSLFILPLHQGVTLWPVVFVQGAMLGHLLELVIRCVSGGNVGKLQTLLIVAALCLFSSLPWFTGQLMPDVFTSVVLLGTFLLAFCADLLSRRELIYVGVLTAAAIATHLSHIVIAFGLILLCGALVPMFVTTQIEIRRWMALLFLPFILAVCSILAVNWINSRAITFARNSNVFLLAKLIEEGPALAYLVRACPDIQYSLCAHTDEMKGMHQDDLKWWGGSPFYKVGGLDQLEPEARRIVWATLRTYPVEVLKSELANAGQLIFRFGIGEGLTPGSVHLVAPYIREIFGPDVEKSLLRSRQAHDQLPIAEFRRLHAWALASSFVLGLWSLIRARGSMQARLRALYVFVPMAVLCNVVITAALSGPFDRYLARVSWLILFVALVGFVCADFGSKNHP